jgi:membrane protein
MLRFKIIERLTEFFNIPVVSRGLDFFKHYLGGIYHRLDRHHVFLSGGGIAFSLFASIIPMTLIIFSILGNLINQGEVEQQVTNLIQTIIPYPDYADRAKEIIMSRIPEVVQYKDVAGYLGGFGLFFIASGLFSSMRTVLNNIFGVTDDKSMIIGKLRDIGMILLLIVFLLLLIFFLPSLQIILQAANKIEFLEFLRISAFLDWIISVTSIVIIFILFFIFYYVIPYEKLGKKVPLVSAFWVTLLWEVARQLFGYYISNVATLSRIYGTYAVIVIVALWIYYSSILFILGAEIGQLYRERKEVIKDSESGEI